MDTLKNLWRKENIGWTAIVILTLIPVVRWGMILPLVLRFRTFSVGLTSIADILGISGMMLFALSLIMSIRTKYFEDFFGGMNKVYIVHHLVGSFALVLLLCHPLFIAASYAQVSVKSAALLLIPGSDWALNFGIISLLGLILLIILTLFIKLPYQIWRLTHQFMGVAFFSAGLHAYLIPADVAYDKPLRYYMLAVSVIALIGYIYRTLLGRFLVKKYKYFVSAVRLVSRDIIELEMIPASHSMSFRPGQFCFIEFHDRAMPSEPHPFSISSAPTQRELKLTIKSLGDWTNILQKARSSMTVYIEGAYGRFIYEDYKDRDQVWIAGGIGITPFLSMARTFYRLDYRIDLIYVVHDQSDAVYFNELLQISGQNPNFRVFLFETVKYGHATAQSIAQMSGQLQNKELFICGPPPMMYTLKNQLSQLHVPRRQIHSEEFEIQSK
ncbi:MAG: hypothetical protein RI947_979 [Candidatus Parcubacteria bacterium]|jgi:predicted ferric reductase